MTGMREAFRVAQWPGGIMTFFFKLTHVVPFFADRRAKCDAVCAVSSFAILYERRCCAFGKVRAQGARRHDPAR